jgi:hypothetical protein
MIKKITLTNMNYPYNTTQLTVACKSLSWLKKLVARRFGHHYYISIQ